MSDAQQLVTETEAYLRAATLAQRFGQFIADELAPLIQLVQEQGGDVHQRILRPVAALLRDAAEVVEFHFDDDLADRDDER